MASDWLTTGRRYFVRAPDNSRNPHLNRCLGCGAGEGQFRLEGSSTCTAARWVHDFPQTKWRRWTEDRCLETIIELLLSHFQRTTQTQKTKPGQGTRFRCTLNPRICPSIASSTLPLRSFHDCYQQQIGKGGEVPMFVCSFDVSTFPAWSAKSMPFARTGCWEWRLSHGVMISV